MNRLVTGFAIFTLLMTLGAAFAAEPAPPPAAQAAAAASEAPFREGPVWDLTFIRIVPGMGDDYLKSLSVTWKRSMEEAKKQGIVVSYKVISAQAAGADDWNLLLMVEFKNWAALDGVDAKFRAIEARTIGDADQMRALMTKRIEVRRLLGGKVAQELFLK